MEHQKIWFHVDVNSAFLSWEAVWRRQHGQSPDLRDIPSVVGGNQATRHGIVLAKSIPAKKRYNVHTGEALAAVRRRAPGIVVVPPRYGLYVDASASLMEILRLYSPRVQRFSIDEAFLDYTGMEKYYGPAVETARALGQRIREELGFTVNIGVSTNKLLCKMASEFEKPDRVHTLFPHEIGEKMWPLPVEELYMVGRNTAARLYDRGIRTIGDLARQNPDQVYSWLKGWGLTLWNFANGRYVDSRNQGAAGFGGMAHAAEEENVKGMGNSGTIAFDITDRVTAHKALLALSETVGARLRAAGRRAWLVSVSFVTHDFQRFGRQHRIDHSTNATTDIFCEIVRLFDALWQGQPIRQLCVWSGQLESQGICQTSMLNDTWKWELADRAVDSLRLRYGDTIIQRACFLGSEFNPMMGGTGSDRNFPAVSEGII